MRAVRLARRLCAQSVENEGEHVWRAIIRARCGSPERTGELEEVRRLGVLTDAAVLLPGVEQLADRAKLRQDRGVEAHREPPSSRHRARSSLRSLHAP